MDEMVEEKLHAMGYKDIPEKLAAMLAEFKKRQDQVRPAPLSLDAIVMCSMIYDMRTAKSNKKEEQNKEEQQ